MKYEIPQSVLTVLHTLEQQNFEVFLVGGCVRDLLLGREVTDWDLTTNAKPEEMQKIFPDSFYENDFGTVGVKTGSDAIPIVEVTTYRKEEAYTDKRHPDAVSFSASLEEDLARRDFTINAIAMDAAGTLRDPYKGQGDLEVKVIRAVGKAEDRFNEDALRLMRAVRFAAQLSFAIEEETARAITAQADGLSAIAQERIRDEFVKIIASDNAEDGVRLLHTHGLLRHIIPELEEGVDVMQGKHHIYTVFEHNVRSLGYAAKYGYDVDVRLAALLHDVGKPRTKRGEGDEATFYNHEVVGARMTKKILERMHFSRPFVDDVVNLVRHHMFYYDVGEVTEKSIRRLLRRVGPENIDKLLEVRIAERKGSGVPKAEPYRLRHLRYMIDKVSRDPLTVGMLKIDGGDVMRILDIDQGPKVGVVLKALLEEVLDDPEKNTKEYLEKRVEALGKLSDAELAARAAAGEEKLADRREAIDDDIKGRYHVK